jgi:hypothetical protein
MQDRLKNLVSRKQYAELTKDIPNVKVKLNPDEVVEGKDALEIFQCIICLGIPVNAMECNKCDTLFCE